MDKTEMEPEKLIPILEELGELLLKYDFVDHATTVAELIDLAHLDSPDFVRELQGGQVWSSTGSIADLLFQGNIPDEGPVPGTCSTVSSLMLIRTCARFVGFS